MGSSSGTALGLIGIILAAGGIGFAFVVWNGQNTTNSDLNDLTNAFNDLTQTVVVGFWDSLNDNMDYPGHTTQINWLIELGDNELNNTDYISVSNTNTRITLVKPGWYRIHLSILLGLISTSNIYRVYILKDGLIEFTLDRFATSSSVDSAWHYFDSSAFVYSDGTNFIELNGYSSSKNFYPGSFTDFNQLTIEYVAM